MLIILTPQNYANNYKISGFSRTICCQNEMFLSFLTVIYQLAIIL